MSNGDLWPLALEVLRALGSYYYPEMRKAATEVGLGDCDWYLLLAAIMLEPEPISCELLARRNPYTAPHVHQNLLQELARQGALLPSEDVAIDETCSFRLSDAGRTAVHWMIKAAYSAMVRLAPIPEDREKRLLSLLSRIVQACSESPEPPGKWSFNLSRKTDPGESEPALVLIDQYLSDLAAYRVDAHLAAWQPHRVSGYAWEAFTVLWRGEAGSIYELDQKLDRRGLSADDYRTALQTLIDYGWVMEGEGGSYNLTASGRKARQEAEDLTDRYFYAPWSVLSDDEITDLKQLLLTLWEGLKQ